MASQSQTDESAPFGPAKLPGERLNVRGQATRLRILIAAERLFAQEGITAVPLRDIGKEAGQRNHAAVQYHFGDRDEVIRAIMEYRGAESERVRSEMVAELMLSGGLPSVHDVVQSFVLPLAIHFQPDNHYLTFLSMYVTQEGGYRGFVGAGMQTGGQVIMLRTLLGKMMPDAPENQLDERWWLMLSSAVHGLAMYQTQQQKFGTSSEYCDAQVADLVRMLSAGMVAPFEASGQS